MTGRVDGDRGMEHIVEQCLLGPRIPGTEAQSACRDWIACELGKLGMKVRIESFDVRLPLLEKDVPAYNIWGMCCADRPASPTLMITAHWDTRPYADMDPDVSRQRRPFDGANDGASGVALALELMNSLKDSPLADNIVVVFWDAEDSGINDDPQSWALGSSYAADHSPAWIDQVVLGVNLDMVAGSDLSLVREGYSVGSAPGIVKDIWELGEAMAPDLFEQAGTRWIYDDHVPWIRKGVPFVNIIGLPYRQWHTTRDVPSSCSSDNLERLGNVILNFILYGDWSRHDGNPGNMPMNRID